LVSFGSVVSEKI